MAFFDDLSKKITDASTKTIQKGKDLTDVARLNSQISAEENRINTLYGMIGKQYMELHRKDAEDAFAGLVASVAEAEQNIAACRAKITELRAVPHCPNCGAEPRPLRRWLCPPRSSLSRPPRWPRHPLSRWKHRRLRYSPPLRLRLSNSAPTAA